MFFAPGRRKAGKGICPAQLLSVHDGPLMYGQTLLVDLLGMHCQVKEWTPFKSALLMAIHAKRGLVNRLFIEWALIIDFQRQLCWAERRAVKRLRVR